MRRIRKKFKRPKKAWGSAQIKEEKDIVRKYGLKKKRELWMAQEVLRKFRQRARNLIAVKNEEKEKILLDKMIKLGLLSKNNDLDDILALKIDNILDRRLQTIVFKRGMCGNIKQSRQLIVHGHVGIDKKKTTSPSYLVTAEEENKVEWYGNKMKGGK